MHKIELKDIFHNLQVQMLSKLSTDKTIIKHPTTKGDSSELNWMAMLNSYLPKRYKVDKAFVLDSEGTISDQIDIVIYDNQYSPFLFNQDNAIYIPAESVYAVFEVKPTIDKENYIYAGEKIKSVRLLKRTSTTIVHAGGLYEPKSPFNIIGGLLAIDCSWKKQISDKLIDLNNDIEETKKLNIGCALQDFSFYFKKDTVDISESNNALIYFFLHLLGELQKLGTAPALNIYEYGKFLDLST